MKKTHFTFVERSDSNKQFENHLSASIMAQIFGGNDFATDLPTLEEGNAHYCNPWYSCDAWNCAPDCTCKNLV